MKAALDQVSDTLIHDAVVVNQEISRVDGLIKDAVALLGSIFHDMHSLAHMQIQLSSEIISQSQDTDSDDVSFNVQNFIHETGNTLDQFITIDWQLRQDTEIHIHSELATFQTHINSLESHPKLQFVLKALHAFQPYIKQGLNITIQSEFSSTIGLGSSAAVLAAMLDGLNTLTQQHHSTTDLFEIGHSIIIDIQGRGSGTDLAASLTGGGIFFEPKPNDGSQANITKLSLTLPLCLLYAGYKTPTADVLAFVAQQWQDQPKQLKQLYQQMGQTTLNAFKTLQKHTQIEGGENFLKQNVEFFFVAEKNN